MNLQRIIMEFNDLAFLLVPHSGQNVNFVRKIISNYTGQIAMTFAEQNRAIQRKNPFHLDNMTLPLVPTSVQT